MIGMAANTIFVVSPMTTRHQCAQTTPWPIFKPVILAYFLAGGNTLSKARSEGALRENMANADMRASVKEMSTSSQRGSGRVAKPLRTKWKSASAERCLRSLGATMDIGNPITRTSKRSSQGVFSHQCLRKASAADPVITGLGGSAGIAVLSCSLYLNVALTKPKSPCEPYHIRLIRHQAAARACRSSSL